MPLCSRSVRNIQIDAIEMQPKKRLRWVVWEKNNLNGRQVVTWQKNTISLQPIY